MRDGTTGRVPGDRGEDLMSLDDKLDVLFGPLDTAGQQLVDAAVFLTEKAIAEARAHVSDERVEEILTDLNGLIHTLHEGPADTILVGGRAVVIPGDVGYDYDPDAFAEYARSLVEVDWAKTTNPQAEIFLCDGTVLWFESAGVGGPSWEAAVETDLVGSVA